MVRKVQESVGRQCPAAYLNLLDCCVLSEIGVTQSYQDIFPYNGAAYMMFLKQIDTPAWLAVSNEF